ncbi:unnamed protein product [Cylicocyclus nassatus]|uniref:Uncharacterized protein n=1 Tax=Cylicocyclus nassatus TaxID=53992 RepID=A0AA36DK21_CYLNA|nr:unnamed protein product [Cylicocyclus nassatus]
MVILDSKLCETMLALSKSPILISVLALCDLCCIVAAPLLSYWLVRIWKVKLMHYNSRMLLCFHIACLLLHVLGRAFLHSTDLIIFATSSRICDVVHTRTQCFFLRLPFNVAMFAANCSAIFASIERLIATLNIRNYEKGFRNVGHYLLLSQIIMSACLLGIMYSQTRLDDTPLIYCQTTSPTNYMWTVYPFAFQMILQILSVLLFEVADRKNKICSLSNARRSGTLSGKFQLEENLWTIRTLKAYVYLNSCITATYLITMCIILFKNELLTRPTYYSLIEGTSGMYLYSLALPLLLWYTRKDVKNEIRSAVNQAASTNSEQLFRELQLSWSSHWNIRSVSHRNY